MCIRHGGLARGLRCRAGSLFVALAAVFLLRPAAGKADDWTAYRGPDKNGATRERIVTWPPVELWRAEVGQGYSQVVVSEGRVYTMGWQPYWDTVFCFSEASAGANPPPLWTNQYWCGNVAYPGTRATPTVEFPDLYTYSHEGRLSCFNAASGTAIWDKSVGGGRPGWGFGSSPLVEGNLVVVNAGSFGKAVDRTHPGSHNVLWGDEGGAGYASPFALNVGTQRTVVVFGGARASGVDPLTGRVLWYFTWDQGMADPIIYSNKVWVSCGYRTGCAVVKLGDGPLTVNEAGEWNNTQMGNKENCSVLYDGHVYGINEAALGGGLRCIEFATGLKKWSSVDAGVAFGTESAVMLAGNQLVIINGTDGASYDGDLVVAQATPAGYAEVHRANDLLPGDTWTCPTIANGRLYLRNQPGTLVCYRIGAVAPEINVYRAHREKRTGSTDAVTGLVARVPQRLVYSVRNAGFADLNHDQPPSAAREPGELHGRYSGAAGGHRGRPHRHRTRRGGNSRRCRIVELLPGPRQQRRGRASVPLDGRGNGHRG